MASCAWCHSAENCSTISIASGHKLSLISSKIALQRSLLWEGFWKGRLIESRECKIVEPVIGVYTRNKYASAYPVVVCGVEL